MTAEMEKEIAENIARVWRKIQDHAEVAGRDPERIKLLVVTKEKSAIVVKTLVENGIHRIGESYFKEASFKIDLLQDFDIEWHMIGYIQSGKAKQIAQVFDCVHSVDRRELAELLDQGAAEFGKKLPVFLECNVSGEATKHGWSANEEDRWDELAEKLKPVLALEHLKIMGLMTIAPYAEDPEKARPYFQRLARLLEYLQEKFPEQKLEELSMGMSGDYTVALEEGATYLRIGSAIVGKRD